VRNIYFLFDFIMGGILSYGRLAVTQSMGYLASGLKMLGKVAKQYKFILILLWVAY
jgi:hypothetical protein